MSDNEEYFSTATTTVSTTGRFEVVFMPPDLDEDTVSLVVEFAEDLAKKLKIAQDKYGYSNGWRNADWMDECRAKLQEHLLKGDPIDVAAYCAFLNYHKEPTYIK